MKGSTVFPFLPYIMKSRSHCNVARCHHHVVTETFCARLSGFEGFLPSDPRTASSQRWLQYTSTWRSATNCAATTTRGRSDNTSHLLSSSPCAKQKDQLSSNKRFPSREESRWWFTLGCVGGENKWMKWRQQQEIKQKWEKTNKPMWLWGTESVIKTLQEDKEDQHLHCLSVCRQVSVRQTAAAVVWQACFTSSSSINPVRLPMIVHDWLLLLLCMESSGREASEWDAEVSSLCS